MNQFPALMLTNIDFTHTECGPQIASLLFVFVDVEILFVPISCECMAHSDCGVYRLHYGGFCPFDKSKSTKSHNRTFEKNQLLVSR